MISDTIKQYYRLSRCTSIEKCNFLYHRYQLIGFYLREGHSKSIECFRENGTVLYAEETFSNIISFDAITVT